LGALKNEKEYPGHPSLAPHPKSWTGKLRPLPISIKGSWKDIILFVSLFLMVLELELRVSSFLGRHFP
jgi:hypothetical protein